MLVTHEIVQLFFAAALFVNAALFIPQALRIIREKHSRDVSLITFSGFFLIQLATVCHAIIAKDDILLFGNALSMVACACVVALTLRYRKQKTAIIPDVTTEEILAQFPAHLYWKDKQCVLAGCNTINFRDFGLNSLDEFIGNSDYDLFSKEDADRLRITDEEVMRDGKVRIVEEALTGEDGNHTLYMSIKAPLKNKKGEIVGILGCSMDITDSKRETLDRVTVLENIIAVMPGNVYWMDKEGVYLGCNDNEARSVGLSSRKDIIGKRNIDIPGFVVPEVLDPINQAVIAQGKAVVAEEPAVLADGTQAVFLSNKVPLRNSKGDVMGMLGISFDITDRKKAEQSLIESKKRIEEASQAKTEFLYNMRHDIRTPFSGILSLSRYLAHIETDPKKKEQLNQISEASDTLLVYLNEILEFTQVSSGKMPVLLKPFNLKELVRATIDTFYPAIHSKNIALVKEYDAPEWLIGDRFRIQRILINLLSNSVKFTEKGMIAVSVRLMNQENNNRHVLLKLAVEDTGLGIPKEKCDIIFEKFSKLNSSYSTTASGVGLGLQAVKQLVDDLDGDISVKSHPGKGSIFTCVLPFKLPLVTDSEALEELFDTSLSSEPTTNLLFREQKQKTQEPRSLQHRDNAAYHVLLVEDSRIAQLAANNILESFGCTVDMVESGDAAIKLFATHNYDLILLDVGLPDQNGYQVAKTMRAMEEGALRRRTPIMVLTAHADESDGIEQAEEVDRVFMKPLTYSMLTEMGFMKGQDLSV